MVDFEGRDRVAPDASGAGGFGMTITAGATTQPSGQAFPGQLGAYSDEHIPGLQALRQRHQVAREYCRAATTTRRLEVSPEITGQAPMGPSDDPKTGGRAISEQDSRSH